MRIKVCGITRESDALLASELGAWALGFIFYEKSPRYIKPAKARSIIEEVRNKFSQPPKVVGVFVNETVEKLKEIEKELALDCLQFHGNEGVDIFDEFSGNIRAIRPESEDLSKYDNMGNSIEYILIDAAVNGFYGGTGELSDWHLASKAKSLGKKLILSGGLKPENIQAAWNQVKPYALDLSSGVEEKYGIKSHEKLRKLFQRKESI